MLINIYNKMLQNEQISKKEPLSDSTIIPAALMVRCAAVFPITRVKLLLLLQKIPYFSE